MDSPQEASEVNLSQSVEEWQIEQIKAGIAEADRGEFATDEEVEETVRRFTILRNRKFSPHS
ncbi:MAG: hypothetical protein WB817_13500 [Terriglobales bacterium]